MLLIRISGHSGAGKSRLLAALPKYNIKHRRAVLYTSRLQRSGEIDGKDYYFLSREAIEKLPRDAFLVGPVREMLQAVDLDKLERDLRSGEIVIIEIFYTLWEGVKSAMEDRLGADLSTASVFMTAVDPEILGKQATDRASDRIRAEVKRILEWRGKDSGSQVRKRTESAVEEVLNALNNPGSYDKILFSSPEGPEREDEWTRCDFPIGQAARATEELISFIRQKCDRLTH